MDRINNIGSQIIVDWNLFTYKAASPEDVDGESLDKTPDAMIPEFQSPSWYAMKDLLSRPWFERLWVWQEVTLPKKEISVLCGYSEVPYIQFCNAVHLLFLNRSSLNMEVLALAYEVLMFSSCKSKARLHFLIKRTRGCKCSDQRDKIFGILSLTNDPVDILADYSKPVREVFQDLVTHLLVKNSRLDILTLCSLTNSPLALPSWANWSVPSTRGIIRRQRADAATAARAFSAGSSVLVATGICVAKVDQIEHTNNFRRTLIGQTAEDWEIARYLGNLAKAVVGLGDARVAESRIESLCRALCCGQFSYTYLNPDQSLSWPDFGRSVQYTSQCWEWSKKGCPSEDRTIQSPDRGQFVNVVATYLAGRSVIKTSNGLIGIAPETTKNGDVVCVLLGCSSPLILRPNEAGDYAIVGECYIDGIVTGETILGQLQETWRIVVKWFPQYCRFYDAFHDSQSEICQTEDPRLGPLPAGWREESHYYQDAYPEYVNDETGEDLGYLHPNLRYETLKARGLEFEEFRLI